MVSNQGFGSHLILSLEPTEVFQKHPDWLLKKMDGSLKRIGNWEEGAELPADENPKDMVLILLILTRQSGCMI